MLSFNPEGMGSMLFNFAHRGVGAGVQSYHGPAGVYLAEYARQGPLTRWVRMAIETLASLAQYRGKDFRLPGVYRHDSQPVESAGRVFGGVRDYAAVCDQCYGRRASKPASRLPPGQFSWAPATGRQSGGCWYSSLPHR